MNKRTADTIKVSGGADYAKVAERVKLFREDFPNSKIETDKEVWESGAITYKAWVWKDKTELLELMKAGVTDKSTLRSSADSDGDMTGMIGVKEKDAEKMQTAAIGRALANMGYLASGDIASLEEIEMKEELRAREKEAFVTDEIKRFNEAKTLDELKALWLATDKSHPEIFNAKEKRKAELEAKND